MEVEMDIRTLEDTNIRTLNKGSPYPQTGSPSLQHDAWRLE
jgi:hypothetical protein